MKKKNTGIIFWITGLPGSGKSSIGNKLKPLIEKKYGKTVIIHGDEIRNIYKKKTYKKVERLKLGKSNSDLCNLLSKQGVNVIFTTVGLVKELFNYNKKKILRYVEIFIKSDIQLLINKKKKFFYKVKTKNVWGVDLKPEFPSKPDVLIENKFNKSLSMLTDDIFKKIKKLKKIN